MLPLTPPNHAACAALTPACRAAAGPANCLAVLNPRPDVPPACLAQLHFSLKHGALTLEAVQAAAVPH